MRYDNQVLFDKGFVTLAYRLEAMMDKAPELSDDFDILVKEVHRVLTDGLEDVRDEAFQDGHEIGYAEGYRYAEWEYEGSYDEGYDDGYQNGLSDGYDEGYQDGLNAD
ncbi:hypothetical protein CHCC14819_0467 [Bacillus licheniformis]|uniref:hypothetical protein n=1 Tax=Bacillus licheniformis TaxID=1402 RepID=UPI00119E59FC|nr:hypothetical protein [Bacillus licheniformis]TWM32271.1 hypothetical protein CHCC14819_0467 [Bacillus licheniformis]